MSCQPQPMHRLPCLCISSTTLTTLTWRSGDIRERMLPSANSRSSGATPVIRPAISKRRDLTSRLAFRTACPWTNVARLPDVGPESGVLPVSASTTRIALMGMPSSVPTICASNVWIP